MYTTIFSPPRLGDLVFKNRLTTALTYLGDAGSGGTVSPLMLEHYRLMAASGVAMVAVESATIDYPTASGSERTLRADTDSQLDGLKRLAETMRKEGAIACLQINHAGRFASGAQPLGPSAIETFGRMPKELTQAELSRVTAKLAERIIRTGSADRIGLARVLWADPDWLRKVSAGRESEILHCDPDCGDACIQMVMKKKPAFCTRWAPQKAKEYKARFK